MHAVKLFSLNIGLFIVCIYFCLALYAMFLSLMVFWHKRPYVTDQKLIGTLFLCILAGAGFFLFLQDQWIGIVIIYLLFFLDLFLLWIVVPSEFRIICLHDDITPLLIKVLLRINIPFEQKKSKFILLNRNQTIVVKKTFFKTTRIILEPGKQRSLIKDIQKEVEMLVRQDHPRVYHRGIQYLLAIGIGFCLFSIALFFYFYPLFNWFYLL
jgi:hypothetical protein